MYLNVVHKNAGDGDTPEERAICRNLSCYPPEHMRDVSC